MPGDRVDGVGPSRRDRTNGEPTRSEGLLLSAVAGTVDGIGYVLLHVFTAHITGNTVHVGTDVGRAHVAVAARSGFAIVAFVAGVAVGALVRDACERHGASPRAGVLTLSGALLVAFLAVGIAIGTSPPATGWRFFALTATAAAAMGCQNAVMPKVGGRRVRTYITGTMTEFAEALAAAATSRADRESSMRRARELFAVWVMYLAGGVVSGAAGGRWGTLAVLCPIAGLAVAIVVELRRPAPSRWARSPP